MIKLALILGLLCLTAPTTHAEETNKDGYITFYETGTVFLSGSNLPSCLPPAGPSVDDNTMTCDDKHPRFDGILVIRQEPARKLFEKMVDVPLRPADPNLETKKPSEISREMLDAKAGQNYFCFKEPKALKGDKVETDEKGHWKYEYACYITISSLNEGRLN